MQKGWRLSGGHIDLGPCFWAGFCLRSFWIQDFQRWFSSQSKSNEWKKTCRPAFKQLRKLWRVWEVVFHCNRSNWLENILKILMFQWTMLQSSIVFVFVFVFELQFLFLFQVLFIFGLICCRLGCFSEQCWNTHLCWFCLRQHGRSGPKYAGLKIFVAEFKLYLYFYWNLYLFLYFMN